MLIRTRMVLKRAGYIQKSDGHLIIIIANRGAYIIRRSEAVDVIERGGSASVMAKSESSGGGGEEIPWFEAGRATLSRSGRALLISIQGTQYIVSVQSLSKVFSQSLRYASVSQVAA
jgi:hypothetical protein